LPAPSVGIVGRHHLPTSGSIVCRCSRHVDHADKARHGWRNSASVARINQQVVVSGSRYDRRWTVDTGRDEGVAGRVCRLSPLGSGHIDEQTSRSFQTSTETLAPPPSRQDRARPGADTPFTTRSAGHGLQPRWRPSSAGRPWTSPASLRLGKDNRQALSDDGNTGWIPDLRRDPLG